MTIEQAKEIDIVDFLSKLGYEPERKPNESNYWYCSPLHDEKTPSFKVNRRMNRWKDFGGDGGKGDLINFGTQYFKCSVSDFLKRLDTMHQGFVPNKVVQASMPKQVPKDGRIIVESVGPITSKALIYYYHNRRIPHAIASEFLVEVNYTLNGDKFYALGFKNDCGGYELRNARFKGASSPKGYTYMDNGSKELVVLEGSFDFLSHRTIYAAHEKSKPNFLILNSTSFFKLAMPLMLQHERVRLFLDNDPTGDTCTKMAMRINQVLFYKQKFGPLRRPDRVAGWLKYARLSDWHVRPLKACKFSDERAVYRGYNDLNLWLNEMGKGLHQKAALKI